MQLSANMKNSAVNLHMCWHDDLVDRMMFVLNAALYVLVHDMQSIRVLRGGVGSQRENAHENKKRNTKQE